MAYLKKTIFALSALTCSSLLQAVNLEESYAAATNALEVFYTDTDKLETLINTAAPEGISTWEFHEFDENDTTCYFLAGDNNEYLTRLTPNDLSPAALLMHMYLSDLNTFSISPDGSATELSSGHIIVIRDTVENENAFAESLEILNAMLTEQFHEASSVLASMIGDYARAVQSTYTPSQSQARSILLFKKKMQSESILGFRQVAYKEALCILEHMVTTICKAYKARNYFTQTHVSDDQLCTENPFLYSVASSSTSSANTSATTEHFRMTPIGCLFNLIHDSTIRKTIISGIINAHAPTTEHDFPISKESLSKKLTNMGKIPLYFWGTRSTTTPHATYSLGLLTEYAEEVAHRCGTIICVDNVRTRSVPVTQDGTSWSLVKPLSLQEFYAMLQPLLDAQRDGSTPIPTESVIRHTQTTDIADRGTTMLRSELSQRLHDTEFYFQAHQPQITRDTEGQSPVKRQRTRS